METIDFPLLKRHAPYAQYQIVDVTFGAAYTDTEIRHDLKPPSPEHVDYTVLRQAQAATVFHDMSGNRVPWREGVIRLRSNVPNARVTLLLTVSHEKRALLATGPANPIPAPATHVHDAGDIVSGVMNPERLGTGTPDGTKVLRGDATWQTLDLSVVWPVGSVFLSIDGTDPATTLGFGTWERFGNGRVLVGVDEADSDFDTSEQTGGSKTHTLTTAQLPPHNHTITDPGHTHGINIRDGSGSGLETGRGTGAVASVDSTLSNVTGITVNNAGGGEAHNNLQPYITVFMWKRTA